MPEIQIPKELLDQAGRGNVLLFIGDRLTRDRRGDVLVDQLVMELAERAALESANEVTFPEAAQAYEDKAGRQALVQFLRDRLEAEGDEPQTPHRLIADLSNCMVLATTSFDRRLERAIEEKDRPLTVMVGQADIAFSDESKTVLYKLRGTMDQPDSLIFTEDDHEAFFDDQESLSIVLQGHLACKTILFIGYDLADPHFKRLYRKVTAPLGDFARRAYGFGETPPPKIARWAKRHGVELIGLRNTAFLEALVEQLATRARPQLPVEPRPATGADRVIPERPYKLLDFYDTTDAQIFFGREAEQIQLTSLIHAHRLVILYGASGVGKTSLLLASILPALEEAADLYEILYIRTLDDPAAMIRRAVERRLPEAILPPGGPLEHVVAEAVKNWGRTLVIVFDQFEEFFERFNPGLRQAFIAELGQLYEARDLPLKLVFSLREDWLAAMGEIEKRIPGVFQTRLRLLPLTKENARQAVIGPVKPLKISYAPELVEQMLDDMVQSGNATVMPPQLQLVCDALYTQTTKEKRSLITLADYQAVGGAEDILNRYIETSLHTFGHEERSLARRLLQALVTSQATKATLSVEQLAAGEDTSPALLTPILTRLTGQRLVRRLDDDNSYELAHDILAAAISGWLSEEDFKIKEVREMVAREYADWQKDPAVFPGLKKFEQINRVKEKLALSTGESGFLLRTAVLYDREVAFWLAQASDPNDRLEILRDMLNHPTGNARLTAVRALLPFQQAAVTGDLIRLALEDAAGAVREAAAEALALRPGKGDLQPLVDSAASRDGLDREHAVHALAVINEINARRLENIPGKDLRPVRWAQRRMRLDRNRTRLGRLALAGAAGGAVGFMLAFSPLFVIAFMQLASGGNTIPDTIAFIQLFITYGVYAGAGLFLGIGLGEVIAVGHRLRGRLAGGLLVGGISFIWASFVFSSGDLSELVGTMMFGMLTGLGLTLSALVSDKLAAWLLGGAVSGGLGLTAWALLGFNLAQTLPLWVSFLLGTLVGLSLAFAFYQAEKRWPLVGRTLSYMPGAGTELTPHPEA